MPLYKETKPNQTKPNQTRRQDHVLVKKIKINYRIVDFSVPADYRVNVKQKEKRDKYVDLSRKQPPPKKKKTIEHGNDENNCNWCTWNSFLLAVVVSILLYGCTTWTRTKRLEKNLDGNYTRML